MFRPVAGVSLPFLSWAALAEQSGKLVLLWHITALQQEKQTQKRLCHQKTKKTKTQSSSYAKSHLFTCSFTCGLNLTHFRITVLTSTGFASWDFLIKAAAVWWQMNQRSVSFSIMPQSKAGLTFTHAHTHIHTNHLSMIKQKTLKVWDGCIQSMGELTSHRTV